MDETKQENEPRSRKKLTKVPKVQKVQSKKGKKNTGIKIRDNGRRKKNNIKTQG